MGTMAEEMMLYVAKIDFQHKFVDVQERFEASSRIRSPTFFARTLPFRLELYREQQGISCSLICEKMKRGCFFNVEYQLYIITPSKRIQFAEFSGTLECFRPFHKTFLSEIFPGEDIFVDDAVTLELSLWADEPEGIEFKPPKEKLRQDLQIEENQVQDQAFVSLLDSGKFSDVTFIVSEDSSRIKAHKNILAARSDVFARMLSTDMTEAKENEIKIDDMGAPALKIMLHHIYSGQLEFPKKIDLKSCQELANAGEKYDLQNLKKYAAMAMTEFVSMRNARELFNFAERLEAEAATNALASYCWELGTFGKMM